MQVSELLASLTMDWWRYVWIPILTAVLTWMATRGKTIQESLGARDGSIQTREERLFTRYNAEIGRLENLLIQRDKTEAALRSDRDNKDIEIGKFREYSGTLRHQLKDARHKAQRLWARVPKDRLPTEELVWEPIPQSPDEDEDDDESEPGDKT